MIYIFLAHGFEEVEAVTPIDLLRRCELNVLTVGIGGNIIKGSHGISIMSDITDNEIEYNDDLEMIILPGGMPGTLNLDKNENVHKAIDYCIENNKYIAAICAAPSILGRRNLLKNIECTCFPGFETQLNDANLSEKNVCFDKNIITANGAGSALDFSLKLIEIFTNSDRSDLLAKSLQYVR